VTPLAAILLVGGRSARMGRPKALLAFDGEPLVAHVVRRLARRFPEVAVVAADGQALPPLAAHVVRDELPDRGPLAGLMSGLRAIESEAAFAAACDAPFLDAELAFALATRLGERNAVLPRFAGLYQPLHAVYRRSAAERFATLVECGELRAMEAALGLDPLIVEEDEIRAIDPEGLSFRNLNTPEDYDAARELWTRRRP
jgi:molybdenum cofactor guanylyltransferase